MEEDKLLNNEIPTSETKVDHFVQALNDKNIPVEYKEIWDEYKEMNDSDSDSDSDSDEDNYIHPEETERKYTDFRNYAQCLQNKNLDNIEFNGTEMIINSSDGESSKHTVHSNNIEQVVGFANGAVANGCRITSDAAILIEGEPTEYTGVKAIKSFWGI